jgi:hypothetical protein
VTAAWYQALRKQVGRVAESSFPTRQRRNRSRAKCGRAGARDENGRLVPLDVKVGGHVLSGKWAGTEVLIDGEERLILKQSERSDRRGRAQHRQSRLGSVGMPQQQTAATKPLRPKCG